MPWLLNGHSREGGNPVLLFGIAVKAWTRVFFLCRCCASGSFRNVKSPHVHPIPATRCGNVFPPRHIDAMHLKEAAMSVQFRPLHPMFCAEVTRDGKPLDLRQVHDHETLTELRDGMDKYGVLVFPQQPFTNAEQLAFAQRWDGALHAKLGSNVVDKPR